MIPINDDPIMDGYYRPGNESVFRNGAPQPLLKYQPQYMESPQNGRRRESRPTPWREQVIPTPTMGYLNAPNIKPPSSYNPYYVPQPDFIPPIIRFKMWQKYQNALDWFKREGLFMDSWYPPQPQTYWNGGYKK